MGQVVVPMVTALDTGISGVTMTEEDVTLTGWEGLRGGDVGRGKVVMISGGTVSTIVIPLWF